jgi:hypothetical protein
MRAQHLPSRFIAGVLAITLGACGSDESPLPPVIPETPNRPPTIESLRDTTMILGDTLRAHLVASDPDGDRLTYTMTVLLRDLSEADYVAVAGLDSRTGDFWFAPGARDTPDRSVLFTVADEHGYPASTQLNVGVSYYLDQFNAGSSLYQNVVSYAPMGQEFTPSYSALDIVELRLKGDTGAGFVLRVRDGTITGPALATSDTLTLATDFNGIALFEFERVPLTPQRMYVLEIVQVSGRGALAASSGGPSSTYPGGRQILKGRPQETNDLWFKEGAGSPRPPEVPGAPVPQPPEPPKAGPP